LVRGVGFAHQFTSKKKPAKFGFAVRAEYVGGRIILAFVLGVAMGVSGFWGFCPVWHPNRAYFGDSRICHRLYVCRHQHLSPRVRNDCNNDSKRLEEFSIGLLG